MTLYVIEAKPIMAEGIANLLTRLDASKKFVIVKSYNDLHPSIIKNGVPTAFIVDPFQIEISGTIVITEMKRYYIGVPIVIFTSITISEAATRCKSVRADYYINKTISGEEFLKLISNYLGWNTENTADTSNLKPLQFIKFTQRQKQIITLIDSGLNNAQIASSLEISEHTVKVHLWRLYKKLNINSRTQLTKYCRVNGYI